MTALNASGKALQTGAVDNQRLALKRYFRQFRGHAVQVAVEACEFWPAFREVVEPEVERHGPVRGARTSGAARGNVAGAGTRNGGGVLAHDRTRRRSKNKTAN